MPQPKPQFTADQILEAGRRAEAEGQYDYAIQFYKHVADYHPGTREALLAQDALKQLAHHRPEPASTGSHNGAPSWPPPTAAPVEPEPRSGRGRPSAQPPLPRMLEPPPPGAGRDARSWPDAAPTPSQSEAVPGPAPWSLPAPARGYRVGRALAAVGVLVGTIVALLGGVVAVAALTAAPWLMLPSGPITAAGGLGALVVGLGLIFAAQCARALFDTALASRDSAAVLRALARHIADNR